MSKQFEKKELKKKSVNFSEWYTDVILKAELADYAPVKGCMVIRPYGYALWEGIQKFMDPMTKAHKVQNAYFPLFIPEHFLKLEKEHVKGFAPHLAVVTIAGGERLKEALVVRPTSETIMYEMYKSWTQSYRDLPIRINQWNNVVRWEKRTYLFLRTSEFLWQEGHCAHATHEESMKTVMWALDMYTKTYQDLLALYGIAGTKSETEKFAGAAKTFTYEMLMPDGKALQGCTSHDLGQNFAKAFDWTVQGEDGGKLYPWQNSWGLSTRSIGGLIMAHGDDQGLVLPPNIAPYQVVLIPIPGLSDAAKKYANDAHHKLEEMGIRVKCDDREGESAGFKFNKWEVRGAPIRLEVGNKEAEKGTLTLVRRDTMEKSEVKIDDIAEILKTIQTNLLAKHKKFTETNTHNVSSYDEFKKIMAGQRGFISAFWCEKENCETSIKNETKATTRCLPFDAKDLPAGRQEKPGKCIYCGNSATHRWLFAQAY